MRLAARRSRPSSRGQGGRSRWIGRRAPLVFFVEEIRGPARERGVFAAAYDGLIGDVASPDEEEPLARPGMDQRAAFGRREIEVARQRVGALGRLAEQDPDVALLYDRLAVVGAKELDDVLGRELQPCVIVAGGSREFLDKRRTSGLAHHLPGLVYDDELASEIDPDGVPEHRQRGKLGDRSNLGITKRRKSDDDELLIAQGRRPPREDQGQ